MPSLTPRLAAGLVALLVVVSTALRFAAARHVAVPWIAPDEPVYALLGRSLWQDGSLRLLDGPTTYYSLLYPLLVGPPLLVHDLTLGIGLLQLLQALVMSATAALVFVWAAPVAGRRWALVAAALSVAIPGLAYSGLVMTEAAAYPAVTLALLALARVLARPTLSGQALVAAACVLACAVRLQAVVLVPTILAASVLAAWFARERALVRRLAPLVAGCGGVVVLGGAAALAGSSVLGAYSTTIERGYDAGAVAHEIAWHAGDVVILVAAVPLVALAALAVPAVAGRERDPAVRAAVAVTLAYVSLVVVEVGAFASRFVDHLAERDLLTVVPPLLVAFAVWLARGLPRPQPWTSLAAFAVAAAGALLPISRLTTQPAFLDSFNAIVLRRLAEHTSEDWMRALFAATAAGAAAAAVLLPRRLAGVLPAAVGAALVAASVVSSVQIGRLSRADERWWFGTGEPGWVDRVADEPVTYLHANPRFWGGVWKHAFWNRRIETVVRLPDAPLPGPLVARLFSVRFDGAILDGAGTPLRNRLVVVPYGLRPAGRRLAGIGPSSDQPGLELWRLAGRPRVRTWTRGLDLNGDFRGHASVTVYDCRAGRLEVSLIGKTGAPVEARADGRLVGRIELPARAGWTGDLPVRPAPGSRVCVVDLTSAGLVGSTRLEYAAG